MQRLRTSCVIAVVRASDARAAELATRAVVAGGVTAVEITLTVPDALALFTDLQQSLPHDVLLGVGTVTRPEQVGAALSAGAEFLVSPGAPGPLLAEMAAAGPPAIVGAVTATEVMTALDAGADAVKLFPASGLGPRYLRALRGPLPTLRAIPTGGVHARTIEPWLDAGAWAVGVGSELADPRAVRDGEWEQVTSAARELLSVVPRPARLTGDNG